MQERRMSKREKQERIDKVQWQLAEMRRTTDILAYMAFTQLPYEEQRKLQEMWDMYYESAKQSPMAMRFFSQKQAMIAGDLARVKEIAQEAKDDHERMSMPPVADPSVYQRGAVFIKYRHLKKTLSDLGVSEYSQSAQEIFAH